MKKSWKLEVGSWKYKIPRGLCPRLIVGQLLTGCQKLMCVLRTPSARALWGVLQHVRRIATSVRAWGNHGEITPPITPPNGGVVARACGIPHAVVTRFAYLPIVSELPLTQSAKHEQSRLTTHPTAVRVGSQTRSVCLKGEAAWGAAEATPLRAHREAGRHRVKKRFTVAP